jgi:hypothetical protein
LALFSNHVHSITMSVRSGSFVAALASVAAMLCSTVAGAAPATSEEINASNPAKAGADAVGATTPTSSALPPTNMPVTQSKTVELLLQLQDQPQALREGAAKAPLPPAIKAETAMSEPPNPLTNLKAAVLNSSALKPTEGQDSTPQRPMRESERLAVERTGGSAASNGAEPRSSLLNNAAIRFIRENRMLTAGISALVLIAVWGTATFSMRRSR